MNFQQARQDLETALNELEKKESQFRKSGFGHASEIYLERWVDRTAATIEKFFGTRTARDFANPELRWLPTQINRYSAWKDHTKYYVDFLHVLLDEVQQQQPAHATQDSIDKRLDLLKVLETQWKQLRAEIGSVSAKDVSYLHELSSSQFRNLFPPGSPPLDGIDEFNPNLITGVIRPGTDDFEKLELDRIETTITSWLCLSGRLKGSRFSGIFHL